MAQVVEHLPNKHEALLPHNNNNNNNKNSPTKTKKPDPYIALRLSRAEDSLGLEEFHPFYKWTVQ
jgi:hypothetical protein